MLHIFHLSTLLLDYLYTSKGLTINTMVTGSVKNVVQKFTNTKYNNNKKNYNLQYVNIKH